MHSYTRATVVVAEDAEGLAHTCEALVELRAGLLVGSMLLSTDLVLEAEITRTLQSSLLRDL